MAQKPKSTPPPKAKPTSTPAASSKPEPTPVEAVEPVAKKAPAKPAKPEKVEPLPSHDPVFIEKQRQRLLDLRDHFMDQMQSVAQDSLRSRSENNEASTAGQHQADAGSDAYEKDLALSILSQEQDALYEIEEALKRIEMGTYGVCEMSSKIIPPARLEAMPFARFGLECQQQMEKENRGRRGRWDTSPQFMDSADNFSDEEDETSEEDDRKKDL